MPSQEFLWKPVSESDGNLVVLTPNQYNGQIDQVYVVLPNGQRVQGRFSGNEHNGQRGHFRFNQPGNAFPPGSQVLMTLDGGGTVSWGIGNPGGRNTGGLGGSGGSPAQTQAGGSVGFAGTGPGLAFPQANFGGLGFQPVTPSFLPQVNVPFVDPIESAQEIGEFNREQFDENFLAASVDAVALNELEFAGLERFNRLARDLQQEGVIDENAFNQIQTGLANEFNRGQIPVANQFNQGQIAEANQFNQGQRLDQLETALPGARDTILRQVERGNTLAEGRFVSDAEDRAFEVAARNASAEGAVVRGFGDDSVFGRRASELLSAEQRLNLSQVGEQTIDRFLRLGSNLAFDQPIKQNPILDQPLRFEPQQVRTAQDVRGAPSVPASTLAVEQLRSRNELTTIPPLQGSQLSIGQNQFQANLDQNRNQFNSQLDFNADTFNSEGDYRAQVEQLYAGLFNAQQEANAINQGVSTEIADTRAETGQGLSTLQGIGSAIGQVGGIISGVSDIAGLFGIGGGGAGAGGAGAAGGATAFQIPATIGGVEVVGSAATANGSAGYLLADGTTVAASEVASSGTGSFSMASLGNLGTPFTIAAAAIASGRGIYETVQGLTDGDITETDVKNGLSNIFGGFLPQGVNEILGKPISRGDMANAALLANPVTAPFALADMIFGLDLGFGSGKSEAQQKRDGLRNFGEEIGLFFKPTEQQAEQFGLQTDSHYVQLSDGSYYNIGKDGGAKLQNHGLNVDGKEERNTFDIDWSDPRTPEVIGYLNPVAFLMYGDQGFQMMGHLFNASISNTDSLSGAKDNARFMVEQTGIDYETGTRLLKQYRDKGLLTHDDYLAYLNGWNELMLTEGVTQEITI